MESNFLPFELALKLKNLGYDKNYFGWYNNERAALSIGETWRASQYSIPAPLWQEAFDWFRDKYNLHSYIKPVNNITEIGYAFDILTIKHNMVVSKFPLSREENKYYKKYGDAKQACLEKLIEIVKNENKSNL